MYDRAADFPVFYPCTTLESWIIKQKIRRSVSKRNKQIKKRRGGCRVVKWIRCKQDLPRLAENNLPSLARVARSRLCLSTFKEAGFVPPIFIRLVEFKNTSYRMNLRVKRMGRGGGWGKLYTQILLPFVTKQDASVETRLKWNTEQKLEQQLAL